MSESDYGDITGDWNYRSIPANVEIGRDCWFERKETFSRFRSHKKPGLVLGDRVRIYTWTTFNVEESGYLEVGDESVLVGAVFMCSKEIRIGKRVLISYNVTIADSDFHPINPELRRLDAVANSPEGDRSTRPPYVSKPVVIEDDVWIGIGAIILKGVTIGKGARIGAGAVITSDVPAGEFVEGNPGRIVDSSVK